MKLLSKIKKLIREYSNLPFFVKHFGKNKLNLLPSQAQTLLKTRQKLSIELHLNCNINCIFCSRDAQKGQETKSLSKTEVEKLIQQAAKDGLTMVEFSGGEAFLDPNLPEYLDMVHKAGMATQLITNGLMFASSKNCEIYLPRIDSLEISIPAATEQTYNYLTNSNNFSLLQKALKNLKNSSCIKQVFIIILRSNYLELSKIFKLIEPIKNISSIALMYPYLGGRLLYHPEEYMSLSELKPALIDFVKEAAARKIPVACGNAPLCAFHPYEDLIYIDTKRVHAGKQVARKYADDSVSTYQVRKLLEDRVHYPQCQECIYFSKCWGVRSEYHILYDDIVPVKAKSTKDKT